MSTATAVAPVRREDMAIMSTKELEKYETMDKLIQSFRTKLADPNIGDMSKIMLRAKAIAMLEEQLDDTVMRDVMTLKDSQLGFKTDRPYPKKNNNGEMVQPYDAKVVRRCLIVAWLHGAQAVGNQFNIISGQCYLTKEFTKPKIQRWPGLKDFRYQIGVPMRFGDSTVAVECIATWTVFGEPGELRCTKDDSGDFRIVMKTYSSDSPDVLRGKAEAKLFQRVYSQLCGMGGDQETDALDGDELEGQVADAITIEGTATERITDAGSVEPEVAEPESKEADQTTFSDSQTAKNIYAEAYQDIAKLTSINDTNRYVADRKKLIQSAEWSEDLKEQTIGAITELAEERITQIRAERGGKSSG